jgi:hypothetical protein
VVQSALFIINDDEESMPADLFRPLKAGNPVESQRPSTIAIEGVITDLQFSERYIFDFSYLGQSRRCMVVSRLLTGKDLEVGQRIELTGQWSPMVANLFEARAVTPLRELEESTVG